MGGSWIQSGEGGMDLKSDKITVRKQETLNSVSTLKTAIAYVSYSLSLSMINCSIQRNKCLLYIQRLNKSGKIIGYL